MLAASECGCVGESIGFEGITNIFQGSIGEDLGYRFREGFNDISGHGDGSFSWVEFTQLLRAGLRFLVGLNFNAVTQLVQ